MRLVPMLLILCLAAEAWAQQESDASQDAQATKICAELKGFSMPPVTEPAGGCPDPKDLYDHALNDDDFRKAARCAQFYWDADTQPGEYENSATLILLYANGQGVRRNADYAAHIVCRIRSTFESDKVFSRLIVELDASKSGPATKGYTYCNLGFDLGKLTEYECAQEAFEDAQNKRLDHLKMIASKWTAAQRASFNAVLKAHAAYAEANSNAEAGGSGTGRGGSALEAEDNVNEEFAQDIDQLEHGKLPDATNLDYLDADSRLNASYRKVLADLARANAQVPDSNTDPGNVRDAERTWLVYRDDFVAFAKLRWPQVSADSWLTYLTLERIARLKNLAII